MVTGALTFSRPSTLAMTSRVHSHRNSRAARRSCREELKSMFLKAATQMVLGEDQLSDLYSDFGYTVVKWLAEEEVAEAQKEV